MKIRAFAAAALLAVFAASARAQMGGACMMTELQKLCGAPGTPEFQACAKTNASQAMANCQGQAQKAGQAKVEAAGKKSPCTDDVKKFCPGLWPGTPEFSACMRSHSGELTPACAEWGRQQEGKHKAMTPGGAACVSDAKKFCPGLTASDGQKFGGCMMGHYDDLSPLCRKEFKGAKHGKGGDAANVDCMKAMKSLCPDAELGSPEMTKCMLDHRADMPAACGKKGRKG